MEKTDNRIDALRRKYGANAIDNAARAHPRDLAEGIRWADEIDQHYTKLLLEFTYGGMFTRGILDERTRTLVVVGQFGQSIDARIAISRSRTRPPSLLTADLSAPWLPIFT